MGQPPELILANEIDELVLKGAILARRTAVLSMAFFGVLSLFAAYQGTYKAAISGQWNLLAVLYTLGVPICLWRVVEAFRYWLQLSRTRRARLLELASGGAGGLSLLMFGGATGRLHVVLCFATGESWVVELPKVEVDMLIERWRLVVPGLAAVPFSRDKLRRWQQDPKWSPSAENPDPGLH